MLQENSAPTLKYWAFISYSHADKAWGDWLHHALETYRLPRRLVGTATPRGKVPTRLFPVFRDREELPTSSELGGNLRGAIEQSRCLVVICSPRAAASRWVNEEIRSFQRLGRANRIFTLIVAGEPNASDGKPGFAPEMECFPPALRFLVDAHGELTTAPAEPIAADARPGKDGRVNARLKLIAGIVGVDYDALRQRERQRQRRRRLLAAVVSLALLAAFIGVWQWQEARRRAVQAQAAREQAALAARHTADEAEARGRRSLLAGDAATAVHELEKALAAAPDRSAVRLMLAVARERVSGSTTILRQADDEKVTDLALDASGTRLLVTGLSRRAATLWELPGGREVRRFVPPGGQTDSLVSATFNVRGDKVLLAWSAEAVVHDLATGHDLTLPPPSGRGATYCFATDGNRVLSLQPGDGPASPPVFVLFDANDGHELGRFDLGAGSAGGLHTDRSGRTAVALWFRPGPSPPGAKYWLGEPRLLWFEVDSRKVLADLPRHDRADCEISPDGSRLLYGRPDGSYEVRSASGEVVGQTTAIPNEVPTAHWAPDGSVIAVSVRGRTILFDPTLLHPRWGGLMPPPAFDASGKLLAYSDQRGVAHVYDLASGKPVKEFTDRIGWPDLSLFPEDRLVRFTPDGRYLLLAGSGNAVKVWDWRAVRPELRVVGERTAPAPASVLFSPDGGTFAAQGRDAGVSLWDTEKGQLRVKVDGDPVLGGAWAVAFRQDGGALLVGANKPKELVAATVWDTVEGKLLGRLADDPKTGSNWATFQSPQLDEHIRVGWSKSGLVTANFNVGKLSFWNAETYARTGEVPIGPGFAEFALPGMDRGRLDLSADGNRIVVVSDDGAARVFAADGQPVAEIRPPGGKPAGAALNADGSRVLIMDEAGTGTVWEVAGGKKLAAAGIPGVVTNQVRLSHDGKRLAAACGDKKVRVWDAATGDLRFTLEQEKPPGGAIDDTLGAPIDLRRSSTRAGFLDAQFDPSGSWIAGIDDDGTLCLWDLADGRQLLRWKIDPTSRDARLAVDAAGRTIAVYGLDGAVRLVLLGPS